MPNTAAPLNGREVKKAVEFWTRHPRAEDAKSTVDERLFCVHDRPQTEPIALELDSEDLRVCGKAERLLRDDLQIVFVDGFHQAALGVSVAIRVSTWVSLGSTKKVSS